MTAPEKIRRIAARDSAKADSLASKGNRRTRDGGKAWLVESIRLAEIAEEMDSASS